MPGTSLARMSLEGNTFNVQHSTFNVQSSVSAFSLQPSAFPRARRGTILVTAMWGMIVLASIILILGRSMRVEAISSSNRVTEVQTAAIVRGAEQYVLALVEGAAGDPTYVLDRNAESMPVGTDPYTGSTLGYFWLIKPDTFDTELTAFGITDENSKINLNVADRETLMKLPKMTIEIAESIIDWRDPDEDVTGQGAESSFYSNLAQSYQAKNDRFESIEELRLLLQPRMQSNPLAVEDFLYGVDKNHDGILDPREKELGGTAASFNSATGDARGIAPYITVHTIEANNNTGKADVNGDSNQLRDAMRKIFNQQRADQIVQTATSGPRPPGSAPRFSSVFDFCFKGQMTPEEVTQAYDKLHANRGRTTQGRINLNSAPKEVIAALPGLLPDDAEKLASARVGQAASDMAWVYETLGPEKAAGIGSQLTNKSYQYSADIVAISANGRSFKRVRIVVDGRQTPARIVYRKDVTDLGWPLSEDIRYTLREGGVLDTPFGLGGF